MGYYRAAVMIGVQIKVSAMYVSVKGNAGLTASMHSARVTLNPPVSRSMGLHVRDGMRDSSHEPHVMPRCGASPRARARAADVYAQVRASQAIWKNTGRIVRSRAG